MPSAGSSGKLMRTVLFLFFNAVSLAFRLKADASRSSSVNSL